MKNIVVACGTRPDVLKLAPVWENLQGIPDLNVKIWWSGQGKDIFPAEHQYMVDESPPSHARAGWNGLNAGISHTVDQFDLYLASLSTLDFDLVIVHGDDATAYACALAAFNREIPVAHVEAGLRTYADTPFPEEAYRKSISAMATLHFAPDQESRWNLLSEQIPGDRIFVVGNTINDVIRQWDDHYNGTMEIIATLHRRENAGERIQRAIDVLSVWAEVHEVTLIRHPNWGSRYTLPSNITYIDPVPHEDLLEMIYRTDVVVTDSGGLQEECAFLGVPCIVYRESTERTVLVDEGSVDMASPRNPTSLNLSLNRAYRRRFAYGTGDTGVQIAQIISSHLGTVASIAGIEVKSISEVDFGRDPG